MANQNRFKNYSITQFPKNIYVSPLISNSMNTIPSQHQIITIYIFFAQHHPDHNDFINLSTTNKKFKKPLTGEQKNTVSKTICVYIMANQITKFSIINFFVLPNESISQLKLLFHQYQPNSRSKFPQLLIKKTQFLHPVVCKNHPFCFFVLVLAPTNSVEISNKYLFSRCIININGKF